MLRLYVLGDCVCCFELKTHRKQFPVTRFLISSIHIWRNRSRWVPASRSSSCSRKTRSSFGGVSGSSWSRSVSHSSSRFHCSPSSLWIRYHLQLPHCDQLSTNFSTEQLRRLGRGEWRRTWTKAFRQPKSFHWLPSVLSISASHVLVFSRSPSLI